MTQLKEIVYGDLCSLDFSGIAVEALKLRATQECRLSQTQILEPVEMGKGWFSELEKRTSTRINALQKSGFSGHKQIISYVLRNKRVRAITYSIDDAKIVWSYFATKGNEKAQMLLNLPVHKQSAKVNPEKIVQSRLWAKEGGLIEVGTPVGFIDLLTDTEIIEIKKSIAWKAGVGQVLLYGSYYPEHQKRLHLFGAVHNEMKELILRHCANFNILATFEN